MSNPSRLDRRWFGPGEVRRVSWLAGVALLAIAVGSPAVRAAGQPCSTSSECQADEFCQYPWGICYSEEPLGTCTSQGDSCALYWEPVCGCNGQTYTNEGCALIEGASILHDGECGSQSVCGGYLGIPCAAGEYCAVDLTQCGVYFGQCESAPIDCAAVCEPVCGCDGLNYANTCQAQAAGFSVLHAGECEAATDRLISGVTFESKQTMRWDPETDALAYNVYRKVTSGTPPDDAGSCLLGGSNLTAPEVEIHQDPQTGDVWFLQVAGEFEVGAGSLGTGSDCRVRIPAVPCG